MDTRFNYFLDELEAATSTASLFEAFAGFNRDAGFFLSFYVIKPLPLRARRLPPEAAYVEGSHKWAYQDFVPYTDGAQEIWDVFDKHRLYDADPLIEHARHSARPIVLGIDYYGIHADIAHVEQGYYDRLATVGLCNSYCIPTVNSFERGFGGAGVHSDLRGKAHADLTRREFARVVAATHTFDKAFHLAYRREYAASINMSEKQMAVLKGLISGFSNEELAERLEVSIPMITVHLKAIRAALGVETNREIPTAALAYGLVGDV